MTNNTKQGLIVIGLTLGSLFTAAFFLSWREGIRQSHYVVEIAIRNGLEQSYRDLTAHETNPADPQNVTVTTTDLWIAFCDTNRGIRKSAGYPFSEDIFLSKEPVKIGSPTLFCVVQRLGSIYGINAAGEFRPLTNGEFDNWPHVSAKDFMTNR